MGEYVALEDKDIVDTLVDSKIASSKREARELLNNGSITINGNKVTDLTYQVNKAQALFNRYTVIRKGKKSYFLINHG